jgi:hypothetical protein
MVEAVSYKHWPKATRYKLLATSYKLAPTLDNPSIPWWNGRSANNGDGNVTSRPFEH